MVMLFVTMSCVQGLVVIIVARSPGEGNICQYFDHGVLNSNNSNIVFSLSVESVVIG